MEKNIESNEMNLQINVKQETLRLLKEGNFNLTIYKGVNNSNEYIFSTVWSVISAKDLAEENTFTWSNNYQGFISRQNAIDRCKIDVEKTKGMDLGDTFTFNEGKTDVTNSNNDDTLTLVNSGHMYTAGISVKGPNTNEELFRPICAVLMDKKTQIKIKPKNKILVAFTTNSKKELSTCVKKIHTEAATIEYFEGVNNHEISYDFDSRKWQQFGVTTSNESNGWFRFVRMGAGILNKVLNG